MSDLGDNPSNKSGAEQSVHPADSARHRLRERCQSFVHEDGVRRLILEIPLLGTSMNALPIQPMIISWAWQKQVWPIVVSQLLPLRSHGTPGQAG